MGRKRAKQKRQDLRKGGRVNKFMGGFAEPNLEQLEAAVQENLRRDRLGLAPSLPACCLNSFVVYGVRLFWNIYYSVY